MGRYNPSRYPQGGRIAMASLQIIREDVQLLRGTTVLFATATLKRA